MIKVFVNVGVHPRYKYMIDYPPEGVKYLVSGRPDINQYYNVNNEGKTRFLIRSYSNYIIKYLGIPRVWYYKNIEDADLIYSTRGIIPLNNKPFIVEGEHPMAFVGLDPKNYGSVQKFWINLLLKRKAAKKIIMVTRTAANVMKQQFPSLKEKVDFVYAAIPFKEIKKKAHDGFVITMFNRGDIYSRGLRLMLNVLPILKKKYPVRLRVVTNKILPEDQILFKKYEVEWINKLLSEEEEDELFASSDVFVHLTYVDTAGNIIYNAMRAGLPLILSDVFSNPEKVKNFVNGFLIHFPNSLFDSKGLIKKELGFDTSTYSDPKIEEELIERIIYLIKHKREREKMGEYNKMLIREGKFSMKERNKKLKAIFEEALN